MAKKPRPRSQRREAARALAKLGRASEQLFRLEPGGSPERPLQVESAALVEVQAESFACPRCAGAQQLTEHLAVTHRGTRLREARVRCRQCGSARSLWFQLASSAGPN